MEKESKKFVLKKEVLRKLSTEELGDIKGNGIGPTILYTIMCGETSITRCSGDDTDDKDIY